MMTITNLVVLDGVLQRMAERTQDRGPEQGNVNFDGDSFHLSAHVEQRRMQPELELMGASTDLYVRVEGPGQYEVWGTYDGQTVRGITTPSKDHLQVGADLLDTHAVGGGTAGLVCVGGRTQTYQVDLCRDSQTADYLVGGKPVAHIRTVPQGSDGVLYTGTVAGKPFSLTEQKTLA